MTLAILDIDGTLVDTNYQHAIAWFRAFRQHVAQDLVGDLDRGGDVLAQSLGDFSHGRRVELRHRGHHRMVGARIG